MPKEYIMKYADEIMEFLDNIKFRSTTEIMRYLRRKTKKEVNWTTVYRTLKQLEKFDKVEMVKLAKSFGWRKKR